MQLKIFIGSASKEVLVDPTKGLDSSNINTASISNRICEHLRRQGHKVFPWWEPKTIPEQSKFFEEIEHMALLCDFGVFILSADHEVLPSGPSPYQYMVNGNVTLEMGMFLSSKGRNSVVAIPQKLTTGLSDLQDLKWERYDFASEWSRIEKCVDDAIARRNRQHDTYAEYQLLVNNKLHQHTMQDDVVSNMGPKSFYLGLGQAVNWGRYENNDEYLTEAYKEGLTGFLGRCISDQLIKGTLDNAISFGPGIGTHDMVVLEPFNDDVRYLPIDINPHLAMEALRNALTVHGDRAMPKAVVDDFERNMPALRRLIRTLNDEHHTTLFMMLGGTFGNLENANSFLKSIEKMLTDDDDRFLLDAYIMGKNYSKAVEAPKRSRQPGFRAMMVGAVHRKASVHAMFRRSRAYQDFKKLEEEVQEEQVLDHPTSIVLMEETQTGLISFELNCESMPGLKKQVLKSQRYDQGLLEQSMVKHDLVVLASLTIPMIGPDVLNRTLFLLKHRAGTEQRPHPLRVTLPTGPTDASSGTIVDSPGGTSSTLPLTT